MRRAVRRARASRDRGAKGGEISHTTPLPAKIYANEGIAQVLFFRGEPPLVSYKDKREKYQAQRGVTLPRL